MATPNPNSPPATPPPMVFDDAPAQPQANQQQPPPMVFDDAPAQPQANQPAMTFDAPQQDTGIFHRIAGVAHNVMDLSLPGQETVGVGKEAATALAGILNIVNQHAGGAIPKDAQQNMQKAAQWLKEQGQLRGWSEPGGAGEHMGAMGADYLGWEGLTHLIAGAGAGVGALAEGSSLVKTAKQMANVGDLLDKYPVLKQAAGIGLRTISEVMPALKTVGTGYAQSYIMSGGDTGEAKTAAILSGILHVGAGQAIGPLAEYLAGLKREAAAAAGETGAGTAEATTGATPPPVFREPEAKPEPPTRTPEPQPEPPAPPEPRTPAAERLAAIEQPTAQAVTQGSLEDLNRYRSVDERGTPTNIQQLGLPSQSVTQPYQFVVPGWSATSEAGDLLHDAGARYRQAGTFVAEGKGQPNMQPWEARQVPFDLERYAQEPGAVVRQTDAEGNQIPLEPNQQMEQGEPATPPETPTISHREPIMKAIEYRTGVRPGSDIRQATTVGGPSIMTTDPEVAAGHLDQIDRIVQGPNFNALPVARQIDILQSRDDVMRQMQEYKQLVPQHEYSPYLHQPTFEPVNIDQALSRVGDMGDAAQEMMRGPKEMYQRWTQLTQDRPQSMGGSFQDLNEEINDLGGKTGAASRQRLAEAHQQMQTMFNGSDPYLGRAGTNIDRAIARSQFNDGYLVDRINNSFTNAWSGAARTGDLDVGKLQSNWKSLVNEVGPARISNVLGPERYDAMNNLINDMAGEPAGDKAAAAAAKAEHQSMMADWKQREATATAAAKEQHQRAMDEWQQREDLRTRINQANLNEWQQNDRINKADKQKWYVDLARNGWHHLASKLGMEGVASIMPRGAAAVISHKVGAALILKAIVTHPAMAKLAYQAAQLGTKPSIYGPVIADAIRFMHQSGAPTTTPQEAP